MGDPQISTEGTMSPDEYRAEALAIARRSGVQREYDLQVLTIRLLADILDELRFLAANT